MQGAPALALRKRERLVGRAAAVGFAADDEHAPTDDRRGRTAARRREGSDGLPRTVIEQLDVAEVPGRPAAVPADDEHPAAGQHDRGAVEAWMREVGGR